MEGKIPDTIISEINANICRMRHEIHLYLGEALFTRSKKDPRYTLLITQISNEELHEAIEELRAGEQANDIF